MEIRELLQAVAILFEPFDEFPQRVLIVARQEQKTAPESLRGDTVKRRADMTLQLLHLHGDGIGHERRLLRLSFDLDHHIKEFLVTEFIQEAHVPVMVVLVRRDQGVLVCQKLQPPDGDENRGDRQQ